MNNYPDTKNEAFQAVLLSPNAYHQLLDEITDAHLLAIAMSRITEAPPSSFIPADQLYAELGITKEELDKIDLTDSELFMR